MVKMLFYREDLYTCKQFNVGTGDGKDVILQKVLEKVGVCCVRERC